MQATSVFLCQLQQKDSQLMDRIDEATALISAAAHDIDHPGRSSAFLCNANNFLAVLYNDMCVLESHHAALTFKLTLRDDKVNIFKNLDRETYKLVRSITVDMILATEMTRHFEHLAKFVSVFGTDTEQEVHTDTEDNHMLIRRMLIKCADVSNPARPFGFCVEWAGRFVWMDTILMDNVRLIKLWITELLKNILLKRTKKNDLACQLWCQCLIVRSVALPKVKLALLNSSYKICSKHGMVIILTWLFSNEKCELKIFGFRFSGFIKMPQLMSCVEYNYLQWKRFEERGIHTINDIKREKMTLSLEQNNHSMNS